MNTLNEMKSGAEQTQDAINQIADLANSAQLEVNALDRQVGPLTREADAASNAAGAAQGQLAEMKDEQRARVYPTGYRGTGPGLWRNSDGTILVNIETTLKNAGRTEALYAFPFAEFFPRITPRGSSQDFMHGQIADMMRRQAAFCARIRKRPINQEAYGETVGPNDTQIALGTYQMRASDVALWEAAIKRGEGVAPMVSGCVDYVTGGKHHQTTFAVEVDKPNVGVNPFGAIDPLKDLPLAAGQVLLAVNPSVAGHSD